VAATVSPDLIRDPPDVTPDLTPDLTVDVVREVIVALVRKDGPALSTHQLGVYLTCYLKDGDHTVRGLAAELNVSKSVITRALDKLGELDLTRRRPDPADRRSILVDRTAPGRALLDEMKSVGIAAVREPEHA
jgi:DNA-binding MarR family transcriptional regulator